MDSNKHARLGLKVALLEEGFRTDSIFKESGINTSANLFLSIS